MTVLEAHPRQATHAPGDTAEIVVTTKIAGTINATFTHLEDTVAVVETKTEGGETILTWQPPAIPLRGYGVDVALTGPDGNQVAAASTAFDVLDHWTQYPRYGFLSDFPPDHDTTSTAQTLLKYQVNAVQFYDWMYRHDHLIAPHDPYRDPLNRELSLGTIRKAIRSYRDVGTASMAYVAVYGASARFWTQCLQWALYHPTTAEPLAFGEDFLGLMDPTQDTPWAKHLHDQCRQAIEFGFDGIHLDQYGEPRQAANANGDPVDLPRAFADFVNDLKTRHTNASVTMNAVKNWPIEALAVSAQDFCYIELWLDTSTYQDVLDIVLNARQLSQKPVVVALYLPADRPANVATLDAVLTAAGAWRIEIGENGRLLTDPYFPNHQAVPAPLATQICQANNFAVRYLELCGPPAHHTNIVEVTVPTGMIAVPRNSSQHIAISLVNIAHPDTRWDQPHPPPLCRENVALAIHGAAGLDHVWYATPQHPAPALLPVFGQPGSQRIVIPRLDLNGVVWFPTKGEDT